LLKNGPFDEIFTFKFDFISLIISNIIDALSEKYYTIEVLQKIVFRDYARSRKEILCMIEVI
jgi:hypothetical protein